MTKARQRERKKKRLDIEHEQVLQKEREFWASVEERKVKCLVFLREHYGDPGVSGNYLAWQEHVFDLIELDSLDFDSAELYAKQRHQLEEEFRVKMFGGRPWEDLSREEEEDVYDAVTEILPWPDDEQ